MEGEEAGEGEWEVVHVFWRENTMVEEMTMMLYDFLLFFSLVFFFSSFLATFVSYLEIKYFLTLVLS